jgi:hypothetical protein
VFLYYGICLIALGIWHFAGGDGESRAGGGVTFQAYLTDDF